MGRAPVGVVAAIAALCACSTKLDVGTGCEDDQAFCARLGKNCGTVTHTDDCDRPRTADCGACAGQQACGVHEQNVCDWNGTSWISGVTIDNEYVDAFAAWRQQPIGIRGVWGYLGTWAEIEGVAILGEMPHEPGVALAFAQPFFPTGEGGSLADCAQGRYDAHFVRTARNLDQGLRGHAWGRAYLRLGWEDHASGCPWCAKRPEDDDHWKRCFQRAATAFRSVSSEFRILWDMNRRNEKDVARLWPGDAYVDVVALDFYDVYAGEGYTEQTWREDYDACTVGGSPRPCGGAATSPHGLGAWLAFAKAHGKKLALPEWGLTTGDNPLFIGKMYEFFWLNAEWIEFEALFQEESPTYQMFPVVADSGKANSRAALQYRNLWQRH